jgi:hypothetical protein
MSLRCCSWDLQRHNHKSTRDLLCGFNRAFLFKSRFYDLANGVQIELPELLRLVP